MQEREEFIVDGYQFATTKDVAIARNEQQKIVMLESRMDYDNPAQVYTIYTKAIENRVFQTPIGYAYLKGLQDYLYSNPIAGKEMISIPIFTHYGNQVRETSQPAKPRVKPSQVKEKAATRKFGMSLTLNFILGIIIVLLFVITLTADNPNILNYENALVNKYATWEEQLTQREEEVRKAEQELHLK
ncbi:MAG: hypothetical protein RRX92_04750 [Lachnospiraceae bacterium]